MVIVPRTMFEAEWDLLCTLANLVCISLYLRFVFCFIIMEIPNKGDIENNLTGGDMSDSGCSSPSRDQVGCLHSVNVVRGVH